MPVKEQFLQENGVVHGGIISAMADTTAVYAIHTQSQSGQNLTSIEFKINFLNPAVPDKGVLRAEASVVKRGQTVSLCDVEVTQDNLLIAKGLFTYLNLK
jgi:uncharacterized protein (TIGR00369 family)